MEVPMNRDFTFGAYKRLIITFLKRGYRLITVSEFIIQSDCERFVILRHDIERKFNNASKLATLEQELNVKSSYYFRYNKKIFNEIIISVIENLGHEVGYHYETLAKARGDYSRAVEIFECELKRFREITDVKTICAHGSPLSKWDSKKLWEKYNFKDFGILGEPNFSLNFNEVLYLTDTGRRWNGERVSVRDKANSKLSSNFKSTFDIIKALNNDELPDKLMINVHPHRWNDEPLPWLKELIWQNTKNVAKKVLVKVNR